MAIQAHLVSIAAFRANGHVEDVVDGRRNGELTSVVEDVRDRHGCWVAKRDGAVHGTDLLVVASCPLIGPPRRCHPFRPPRMLRRRHPEAGSSARWSPWRRCERRGMTPLLPGHSTGLTPASPCPGHELAGCFGEGGRPVVDAHGPPAPPDVDTAEEEGVPVPIDVTMNRDQKGLY